jgi:UDPglucose 6-dehydrogenase
MDYERKSNDSFKISEIDNHEHVGIIGLGFVGNAIKQSFERKHITIKTYDKYKDSDNFVDLLETTMIFLCLPTPFDEELNEYNKCSLYETCMKLNDYNYNGLVIIKSTIEPKTTMHLASLYSIKLIHNPEFLTAKTAFYDFENQTHIVLGFSYNVNNDDIHYLYDFYKKHYEKADISLCTSTESESMKLYCNTFYAVKVQMFNEFYLLSEKMECDSNKIVELMLKNNWINPMHTKVPGTDGQLSYGGHCFPKDTTALLQVMKKHDTPHLVLESTIKERNTMRDT